jgi:hypothetical protein
MLVGADDGPVDEVRRPIEPARGIPVLLHRREHPVPDACYLPPGEARGGRLPGAVTRGQVPPGRARAQDPQDAIDGAAHLPRLRTASRFGQQRL